MVNTKDGKQQANTKLTFDGVFNIIGGMGIYQIILFICGCFISFFSTENLAMNFIAGDMDHWCNIPNIDNFPFDMQKDIAIPYEDSGNDHDYSQCEFYDLPYWNYTLDELLTWNRSQRIDEDTTRKSCQHWTFERSLFTETIVSQWQLVCNVKWKKDIFPSLHMAGVFVGALLTGVFSDSIGRRFTALLMSGLKICASFLCVFAPNYETACVARVLLGVSSTGVYLAVFVLWMELAGPRHRVWTGCVYQVGFSLGFCSYAGMSYLVRDHLKLQLCIAGPTVIFLLMTLFFPESPRWLILKGRYSQADRIICSIAEINGRTLPENFSARDVYMEREDKDKKKTVIDLFRYSTIRKRTLIVYLHWFTDSLMYYALSLNTSALAGNIFLNTFISGAVEIPANILCWLAMDWKYTGRRLTNSLSLILAGIFSFANIPLLIVGGQGTLINVFSQLGKAFNAMAFTGIYVYSSELFPTEVRNVGVGTSSMCARISGIAAPYIGGPLADVWSPLPSLIFGVFGVVSGGFTLFLPETLGQKMPETMEEAEQLGNQKSTSDNGLDADNKAFTNSQEIQTYL